MRIAVVSTMTGAPWGGSEELWADMAHSALSAGDHVAISRAALPVQVERLLARGAKTLPYENPLPSWDVGRIDRLRSRLQLMIRPPFRATRDYRPDVICVNQGGTYDTVGHPQLLSFLTRERIPYVLVCHYNDDWTFPDEAARLKLRDILHRAFRVVFVSESNKATTERQIAHAIPNGIIMKNPVNLADTTALEWPEAKPVQMACVSRLVVRFKGQDLLLEALGGGNWDREEWRLNMYGDGPDRPYLEDLARHYGIADRVVFHGHIKDIRAVWQNNHLLVMPSRGEGTPLSLVEAMLCGRPAVVTDVGGNGTLVGDGVSGFIAPASKAASIGMALARAWAVRGEWRTMGMQAHHAAAKWYEPAPGARLLEVVKQAARDAP